MKIIVLYCVLPLILMAGCASQVDPASQKNKNIASDNSTIINTLTQKVAEQFDLIDKLNAQLVSIRKSTATRQSGWLNITTGDNSLIVLAVIIGLLVILVILVILANKGRATCKKDLQVHLHALKACVDGIEASGSDVAKFKARNVSEIYGVDDFLKKFVDKRFPKIRKTA